MKYKNLKFSQGLISVNLAYMKNQLLLRRGRTPVVMALLSAFKSVVVLIFTWG